MLTLCEVKEGDDSRLFVVGGIFGENFVDTGVVFVSEVEVCFRCIIWSVDVLIWTEDEKVYVSINVSNISPA